MLVTAAKEWRADLIKKKQSPYYDDMSDDFEVDAEWTTGSEGASVADEANLLEDDEENNEIELAETSGATNWQDEYDAYLREKKSA